MNAAGETGNRRPETGEGRPPSRKSRNGLSGFRFPVSGLLALALLTACAKKDSTSSPPSTSDPRPSAVLRLSQRNEPADLDPALVTLPDEFAILRALSEGLLIPGPNGSDPEPGAAEGFTASPDGLTYTFHLRGNATWSNGAPLTAADFVASYRRLLTPATAAQKASVFYPVKNARDFVSGKLADFSAVGIRASDTHTLVITLEHPNPRFPHYVASGPWLPVHLPTVEKHGRKWTAPENYVGNGPFTLAEWRAQQRLILRKNPRWHGAASVKLSEIHLIRFDSADTEERAFRSGQIDATMGVPQSKIEVYAREKPAELHRAEMIETRYLSFNTQRPSLKDERVRRALSFAIDRAKIVERVTRGNQPIAENLIPHDLTTTLRDGGGYNHRHDPATARQLLASAGVDPATFPRLEVTAWSPSQAPVLEAIQAMWKQELGLEIAIALREAKVHLDALQTGNYDIGFITAIPDVADAANLLGDFVTGASENYPQWSDPTFDVRLSQALAISDRAARILALIQAENRLLESAAVAPLYFNTKIWLMSPRVRGWQEDGLWTRCYHQIYLDEK